MKVEPQQKEAEGGVKVKSEQVKPSVKVKSEQVKPSVVKSESKPVFTVDIQTMHCTMHGTNSQEADQSVPLEKGPENLLVARFGGIVHTTELCNLMLFAAPPKKKPAAAPVMKKPAAELMAEIAAAAADDAAAPPAAPEAAAPPTAPEAAAPPAAPEAAAPAVAPAEPNAAEDAEAEAAAAPDADPPRDDYGVMWYKRDRSCGIRAKFGAQQQLFSFGGKSCTKTKEEMRAFGWVLVADLHAGASIADSKKKGMDFAFPSD